MCWSFVLAVLFIGLSDAYININCPQIQCPLDSKIPPRCRKPKFMMADDGLTRCPACAGSFCGDKMEVCPQLMCPLDNTIPEECRRPNYEIGLDRITLCRMCDSNRCGNPNNPKICPPTGCPYVFIPDECRVPQFSIGTDGVTMCEVCPKNSCT